MQKASQYRTDQESIQSTDFMQDIMAITDPASIATAKEKYESHLIH